ncbi:hypothetical protein RJ639_028206 [Escallonia herrerae]|uniref:Uncharacterized protein n=1 Tax=Escallonia herrerae TaxID=1293975 RepID=A0AA89BQI0_9ASTE|nr:hypothetical protein RJ639_028206 [Escallonia herrerae]
MATSVLMGSDHDNTARNLTGSEGEMPENGKQVGRRRKYNKLTESTQRKKKKPQRGMGVAQLERLRVQEWRNMTEVTPPTNTHLTDPIAPTMPFPVATKFGNYGGSVYGVGQAGWNQTLLLQSLANGSSGAGGGVFLSDPYNIHPYGFRAPSQNFRVGYLTETSNELSSMPNTKYFSDQNCGVCHKKKRINGGNLGCNVGKSMFTDMSPVNGCNNATLVGSNVGRTKWSSITGEDLESGTKAPSHASYPGQNIHQVLGSTGRGGSAFMEYEFLPGKIGCGGCRSGGALFKELITSVGAGRGVGGGSGEASCVTTATAGGVDENQGSNSIDLSLKLSY